MTVQNITLLQRGFEYVGTTCLLEGDFQLFCSGLVLDSGVPSCLLSDGDVEFCLPVSEYRPNVNHGAKYRFYDFETKTPKVHRGYTRRRVKHL